MFKPLPPRTIPKMNWSTGGALVVQFLLLACAFCMAITPSVLKMYETSHWFREYGNPSVYDKAKDWFGNPSLPFQKEIEDSKVLMRIYFFVLPYIAMIACLVLAHLLAKRMQNSTHSLTRGVFRCRTFLRLVPLPRFMVCCGAPERVSVGELLGIVVFLVLNLGTVGVRLRRSLPRGTRKNLYLVGEGDAGKEPIPILSWPAVEVLGKTLGVISIINLGWYLLMPIGRKSVFLEALGLSWDRAIKYHRWVGFYTIAIMFAHGFLYFVVLIYGDGHPIYDPHGDMIEHNLLAWGCSSSEDESESEDEATGCDEDQKQLLRMNTYGIIALVLILIIAIFSLPYFRRYHFEWFFYIHHLFVLVLFFVCLHYPGAVIYLIPGFAMYMIDKLMGMLAYKNYALAKVEMVSPDVLEVSFEIKDIDSIRYEAGQYVFVNVPFISHLQWHPYSLTSSPKVDPGKIFFHIKESGASPDSWTRQVIAAARAANGNGLPMRIDGFYGDYSIEMLSQKKAIALVGGGIGVTPMISLGMDLVATNPTLPVTILWVCRTLQEFEIFATKLAKAMNKFPNLSVKVWITMSHPESKIRRESFIQELATDEEKCEMIIDLLSQTITEENDDASLEDGESYDTATLNNFLFTKSRPRSAPLGNAAAMLVAVVFALVGYNTATKVSRNQEIQNENISTLVDIAFVTGMVSTSFIIAWAVHMILALWNHRNKQRITPATHQTTSIQNNTDEPLSFVGGCRGMELIVTMLKGRIGCRPDFEAELGNLSRFHCPHVNSFEDEFEKAATRTSTSTRLGVLACGPKAMTDAINEAVQNTGPWWTFFNAGRLRNTKEKSHDVAATFEFIEEDWEW